MPCLIGFAPGVGDSSQDQFARLTDGPMSAEAALREIEANAGTQFDPELVPLFLEAVKEEETPD